MDRNLIDIQDVMTAKAYESMRGHSIEIRRNPEEGNLFFTCGKLKDKDGNPVLNEQGFPKDLTGAVGASLQSLIEERLAAGETPAFRLSDAEYGTLVFDEGEPCPCLMRSTLVCVGE